MVSIHSLKMEFNDTTILFTAIFAIAVGGLLIYFLTSNESNNAIKATNQNVESPIKSSPSKFGAGTPTCAFCSKSVYSAEKVQAVGKTWHKVCFKCGGTCEHGGCGKVLSLDQYLSHGEDPFCKPCHSKLFGPRGFGFAGTTTQQ